MNVSVIIPTYNGAHKILNVLKCLEDQSCMDFEVIVVIDGSTDGTAKILRSRNFKFQNFKIIEQSNWGRSVVRNNGAAAAGGDLLIFFDDDMKPDRNCIEVHIQHHKNYPESILTGAQIDEENNTKTDIQLYKSYLSKKWSLPLKSFSNNPLTIDNLFITAANFSVTKKTFFDLKGFDEQLSDVEDFDFAVRAHNQNIQLYYNHLAFALHNDSITCASYIKRLREYKKAHEKLSELKPQLYQNLLRETKTPLGMKAFIYQLFTFKFWVWTVDYFNWLKIFPKVLRFKIYELITTANGVFYIDKIDLR